MSDRKSRFIIFSIIIGILTIAIIVRLFLMQIVSGDEFYRMAQSRQLTTSVIKAPRGDILDRYGKPMVTNKTGYCLQLQKTDLSNDELNNMLLRLIRLIEKHTNTKFSDSFPINVEPVEFNFYQQTADIEAAKNAEEKWKASSIYKFEPQVTAETVFNKYKERYKISDAYNIIDTRVILGIRYDMEQRGFSAKTPYTVITDVDMALVTAIKESQGDFIGVSVTTEFMRHYENESLAAHILGRVGPISPQEFDTFKNQGYLLNDVIGKQGVEKILESYLRGKDGKRSVIKTHDGNIDEDSSVISPIPGNYAVLTIDERLQQVLENSLQETIDNIRQKGGDPSAKSGGDANAGAAVVLDCNNADILAIASYPTYNAQLFNKQYQELLQTPHNPMWNRAIGGTYPPGSIFKMITSIAALESGVITPDTIIYDEGIYKYYSDYQPRCWIWNERHTTHGNQNVSAAIENSCNYFFYEVGRLTGIDILNDYAKQFGLGEYSGIELVSEEARGRLAGPEDRKKYNGVEWRGGDTLQAAIGQSENLFTPIQLANYIATIANGGTRYKPHIIKSIRSSTDNKIIYQSEPEVLNKIDIKPQNLDAVKQGMLNVTETGTAQSAFVGYEIKVGGKTGSAQVPTGSDNGVFVAFAPYDNPQLAVAVIIEHGNKGSDVAPIVKAVFDSYFLSGFKGSDLLKTDTLLR